MRRVRRIQSHLQTMIRSAMVFFVFASHEHTWLEVTNCPVCPLQALSPLPPNPWRFSEIRLVPVKKLCRRMRELDCELLHPLTALIEIGCRFAGTFLPSGEDRRLAANC